MGFAEFMIKLRDGFRFVSIAKLPRESVDSSGNKGVLNQEIELEAYNMMGDSK
jgi:hypothetical protein